MLGLLKTACPSMSVIVAPWMCIQRGTSKQYAADIFRICLIVHSKKQMSLPARCSGSVDVFIRWGCWKHIHIRLGDISSDEGDRDFNEIPAGAPIGLGECWEIEGWTRKLSKKIDMKALKMMSKLWNWPTAAYKQSTRCQTWKQRTMHCKLLFRQTHHCSLPRETMFLQLEGRKWIKTTLRCIVESSSQLRLGMIVPFHSISLLQRGASVCKELDL